jgi:hypothetical protein
LHFDKHGGGVPPLHKKEITIMKAKKHVTALFSVIALFLTLIGCAETENKEVPPAQTNKSAVQSTTNDSNLSNEEKEIMVSVDWEPLSVNVTANSNYKSLIFDEINTLQNNGDSRGIISSFYFPDVEIEGFELVKINISGQFVSYYYNPLRTNGVRISDDYCSGRGIMLMVDRSDFPYRFYETIEEFYESNSLNGGVLRGEFVYNKTAKSIYWFVDGVMFRISVPDELNDFEYLRDLAYQVIDSAELVDVQYELDVLRKQSE